MFGSSFYHSLIRKYVIAFGNLFNDISIQRLDKSGNRIQTLNVPIAYGPKQSFIARIGQNPKLDRDVAIQLPRIGFEITSINYAASRKLNSSKKLREVIFEDDNNIKWHYAPVPYDIQFTLSAFVKNADDGAQIIEQILPYFTPEWTVNMDLIPNMDLIIDIPYTLVSVDVEDTYENDFVDRRAIIWNMDFTCKAYFYGPQNRTGVIKRTQLDFHSTTNGPTTSRAVITPGLTANGEPTSNSAESIDYLNISQEDDYGFATDITFFPTPVNYDPKSGKDKI